MKWVQGMCLNLIAFRFIHTNTHTHRMDSISKQRNYENKPIGSIWRSREEKKQQQRHTKHIFFLLYPIKSSTTKTKQQWQSMFAFATTRPMDFRSLSCEYKWNSNPWGWSKITKIKKALWKRHKYVLRVEKQQKHHPPTSNRYLDWNECWSLGISVRLLFHNHDYRTSCLNRKYSV